MRPLWRSSYTGGMPGSQRPKWWRKARAATLTLAAHVFFVTLLLVEARFERLEQVAEAPPTGQWITLVLPPLPPPPTPETPDDESTPRREEETLPVPSPAPPGRRSTAITLPPPATAPITEDSPAPPARLSSNWIAQASKLAADYAKEVENPPSFSGPVEKMREPCEPRVSSFWGKKKDKKDDAPPSWDRVPGATTMVGGMPIGVSGGALGGGAVGGAGIKIPLREKPEPNKHLFDDMVAGKTPVSSVPHHEKCD